MSKDNIVRQILRPLRIQGTLLAGFLTILPLVVVWIVFDFLLSWLSRAGLPIATGLTGFADRHFPVLSPWAHNPLVQSAVAVVVVLLVLYLIGAVASRVVGLRLINFYERLIARIPLVQSIYSATKQSIAALQQRPGEGSRVVLMNFPYPGALAIGFLMRTFRDTTTDRLLAAVYVPTAPIPTSGYLEIVPVEQLIATDLTMDQAMTMVLSGGATAPDTISTSPMTIGKLDGASPAP
ncbi:MAG: DUF502 domain-containing protein [Alphaproteobacteria bacterium]|jgi:uncharacterized membrane protein|nr:DUF502 domain-containing protein [Alphaproteobacteria bacterium]MBN9579639.1 DUF502 domain-containing protein [Alphaproteobacteria bacterium]